MRLFGYPQQTRNVSLSNASHCASGQGLTSNQELVTVAGNGGTSVLTSVLMYLFINLDPLIGIALNDVSTTLLGFLPGNSNLDLEFRANAFPASGTARIYKGRLTYEKKLLWLIKITRTIFDKSVPSLASDKFIDNYPGGVTPNALAIGESGTASNWFYNYAFNLNVNLNFDFIPVTSALDVGSGNTTLSNADYFAKYTAANPPTGIKAIPFINFTTSFNQNNTLNAAHISFNRRNGDWLALELDAIPNNQPLFDCLNFCSNAQITGSSILCTTGTYTVTNEATIVNWSISEGNALVTFSTNGNQITINQVNPIQSGYITLNVSYSNDRCGSATPAPKRIWVGRPDVQDQNIYGGYNNVPYNTTTTYTVTTVPGATSYYWTLSNLSTNCGCTTNSLGLTTCPNGVVLPKFAPNNTLTITTTSPTATVNWGNCIGTYSVDCVAVNSCGTDGIYYKNVNVYNPNGGGPDPCEGSLLVFPNPVNANSGEPGNISIEVIYPPIDPCDDNPLGRVTNNNDVKIYDFYGNIVFSKRFDSDKIEISNVTLKKGHYILNVFTSKGFYKKEIIVVR